MITLDLNSITFWAIGIVWITVPVLSWLWGWVSLIFYRKAMKAIAEALKLVEESKALNTQILANRMEALDLKTKAETELREACSYYTKITELLAEKQ